MLIMRSYKSELRKLHLVEGFVDAFEIKGGWPRGSVRDPNMLLARF